MHRAKSVDVPPELKAAPAGPVLAQVLLGRFHDRSMARSGAAQSSLV